MLNIMKNDNLKFKNNKVLVASADTLKRMDVLAQNLKSREVFPKKVALAKIFFKDIRSLPI